MYNIFFKPAGAFPYNQFVFILGQYTILNGHLLCYCSLPILYTTMYNIFFKPAGAFPYNQFVFILGQYTILNGHFLCYCSLPILYTTMYNIFSSQQVLSHVTMVKIILRSERELTPVATTTINPQEIKVLKNAGVAFVKGANERK